MKALKVLISAYACEPNKGSEPGVGWNWAKQIAKFAETWVITRANNNKVIEEELKKNPTPYLHFVYYDVPKWLSFWKKKARGLHLYYLLWQIGAYRIAKKLHRQEHFEVVHHLTFGNMWLPTFVPFLKIPFIWGPIGGGERVPKTFIKEFDLKSEIREIIRDAIVNVLRLNLLLRYISKRANVIIAKTTDTANMMLNANKKKVIVTTDVAVDSSNIKATKKVNDNLQIIAVGRLNAWRGFDLLIKALSRNKDSKQIKLLILGEGSDRKRLEKICKKLNLNESVLFTGQVKQEKYLEYLSNSSIFVNPNLKEGGVTVLCDALSFGLPVVCLDVAGASGIVTADCGIKIKPIHPEQTIKGLADAFLKLANDPELRRKMGETGRRRVLEEYNWDKKGEFIRKLYYEVLRNRS